MRRVYHSFARAGGVVGIILLLIVSWSRLTVLESLASPPSEQIGIAACPTGPTISFNPVNPLPGQSVHFSGSISSGSGSITYTWNFGDGSASANGQTQNHSYILNGVYTVLLTVTGQSCAAPVASKNITVGFGASATVLYLPLIFKNVTSPIFPTGSDTLGVTPALPAQVSGLAGQSDPAGGFTHLEWQPNPPADQLAGYRLYRRAQVGEDAFALLATLPLTQTTYTDASPTCGQSYYVTAFNEAGESAASTASYYGPRCP